jgi:hypothetical protein
MDFDFNEFYTMNPVKYILAGREKCPTTGREHWQGYVCFVNKQKSLKNVGKKLSNAHCEFMKGSINDNDDYCTKEKGDIEEYGDKPSQGKRNDLDAVKQKIVEGASVEDLAMDNPMIYHQYGRTLNLIEDITLRKKWRTWVTTCDWYYGPTDTGS